MSPESGPESSRRLRYHGKRVLPTRDRDTWHAHGQYWIIISGLIKPITYE
jgi:hypothetical protein